ncbi:DUF7005 family protein [Desulfosporosinus sp. BICA1-9]|uniref:DUF7005 family protein n=1 Tax=Desulfosporosinus sp. BICA1-9 TaxID=1531958 RepID=UPI00054C111A|nr:hypothetical protein [Desulfosporosinus sp. BICA1-9]KJS87354.1 MAG: hypothetical protein JL57_14325 [Desulfosporosinus sp. BICA1-9]HBW37654.1 hypothetical protein [Desulfosporosinus sp.]
MCCQEFLSSLGASEKEITELINYNIKFFRRNDLESDLSLPLPDEPFVKVWEGYVMEALEKGVFNTLCEKLVQLSFPVQEGISGEDNYRLATLRGLQVSGMTEAQGLELERPEDLELYLHPTPAGRIPVLVAGHRPDFVSLVQALSRRNEPERIPPSMGACMVKGLNNWDRIRAYREKWEKDNPGKCSGDHWQEEFRNIVPRRELYQDTFIILSKGEYSGVTAEEMGLSLEEWRSLSLLIRRGHEAAHYFTLRVFGSARNHAYDELIADCMGIVAAAGTYQSDWFLRFVGLENYPFYRQGGRLENYLGSPPLSAGAFKILQTIVHRASENMDKICRSFYVKGVKGAAPEGNADLLIYLASLSLIELAWNKP